MKICGIDVEKSENCPMRSEVRQGISNVRGVQVEGEPLPKRGVSE